MTYLLLRSVDYWQVELDTPTTKRLAAENLYQVETYITKCGNMSSKVRSIADEFVLLCYARMAHQERWDKHKAEVASVIKSKNASEGEKAMVILDNKRLVEARNAITIRSKAWYKSLADYCDENPVPVVPRTGKSG